MAAALLANTRTRLPNRYASSLLASLCLTAVTRATSAFTIVAAPQKYHRYQLQRNYACVSVGKAKGKSKTSDSVSVSMVKGKLKTTDSGGANARGVMMILSPAKTLDLSPFEAPSPSFPQTSVPNCDAEKTKAVASAMKARSKKDLEKLLGISANLAEKSHQYWTDFDCSGALEGNQKPAIYAFSGAAYQGLDIATCSETAILYMQSNLRIVDPLYGSLRPLDLIQPYRLEMATKKALDAKKMGDAKDLAGWWRPAVTASIGKYLEAKENKILLNIASDEYAAAVDVSALPEGTRYIKVVFQQEGRVIAVHAKKARGMMVRFLSENGIEDTEGISQFAEEGYKYIESQSTDDVIVFDRPKQAAAAKKKKPATKPEQNERKKAKTSR